MSKTCADLSKLAAVILVVVHAETIFVLEAIRAARTVIAFVHDGEPNGLAEGSEESKSKSSLHFVVLVVELCFYFINYCKNDALIYEVSTQIR